MQASEEDLPLDEAALVIAAHASPGLDIAAQLARLDEMADRVGSPDVDGVCTLLFDTLEFRGDRQHYDDPRNSLLDQVLDRHLGIPISLSVLLIEVGRRCGVALAGVGMPGHFLVLDPEAPELLIDAFAGGQRLSRSDCERLLLGVIGSPATLEPEMLVPVGTRTIVARVLANLDQSFKRRSDQRSLAWVTRLRAAIPGLTVANRMALADQLAGFGQFGEAASLLEELASDDVIDADVARTLRTRATGLRAHLN